MYMKIRILKKHLMRKYIMIGIYGWPQMRCLDLFLLTIFGTTRCREIMLPCSILARNIKYKPDSFGVPC